MSCEQEYQRARPKGTFAFPDPRGFDGTAEDFVEFFANEPADDDLFRRGAEAYSARALESHAEAISDAVDYPSQFVPEQWEAFNAAGKSQWIDFNNPKAGQNPEWVDMIEASKAEATRQWRGRWPFGTRLAPHRAGRVIRAAQAVRANEMLDAEERKRAMRGMPFPANAEDGLSIGEVMDTANYKAWIQDDW